MMAIEAFLRNVFNFNPSVDRVKAGKNVSFNTSLFYMVHELLRICQHNHGTHKHTHTHTNIKREVKKCVIRRNMKNPAFPSSHSETNSPLPILIFWIRH